MPKVKRKQSRHNRQKAKKLTDEKLLENLFASYISENKLIELESLLSSDQNLAILKQNRFLDPYVIAIKANHLHLIKFFLQYAFPLQSIDTKVHDCTDACKSVNCGSLSYCRALTTAIKLSNEAALDILIELKVNVNSSNYRHVPLQIAYNIYSAEKEYSLLNANFDQSRLEVIFSIKY